MLGGPSGFILGGVLPVLVGSLVLHFPHPGAQGWQLTLPVIGAILFLVGVFRIWFVHLWVKIISNNMSFVPVLFAVFGLIFGCLLIFAGYIVPLYK